MQLTTYRALISLQLRPAALKQGRTVVMFSRQHHRADDWGAKTECSPLVTQTLRAGPLSRDPIVLVHPSEKSGRV